MQLQVCTTVEGGARRAFYCTTGLHVSNQVKHTSTWASREASENVRLDKALERVSFYAFLIKTIELSQVRNSQDADFCTLYPSSAAVLQPHPSPGVSRLHRPERASPRDPSCSESRRIRYPICSTVIYMGQTKLQRRYIARWKYNLRHHAHSSRRPPSLPVCQRSALDLGRCYLH